MFFDVDAFGNVTLPQALVQITPSPIINVGAFKPGTYNGYNVGTFCSPVSTANNYFSVGSPRVGAAGRISGSIQRVTCDSRNVFNASWTSGLIPGHPHQAKLNAAGITSTAFNWGVMGTAGSHTVSGDWKAGDIIGAVQTGNQLSLVNFGIDNKADATLAFTLCPTAAPC